MANDGQIVFEITADGQHAIADIRDITRVIQSEANKWDDAARHSTDDINKSFSGMLKNIAAGFSVAKIGKALLDIGKDAIEAASDLQEVQNVVDTTFGSNANQIETWAKKATTQFGLTETMAKKFASTMGAMLKSSGMTGDEIVNVSTDLAGLAADMASFYNLDFEEAFAKIRSGISGQTMPLKELGIDMSVATLNAFALEQGLTKTFNEMSQSEQTMLRYQYLMKATADAQGDFADTNKGYANGIRTLTTELDTLKTKLGGPILNTVSEFINAINGLFPKEYASDSLLDKIADVNLHKDEKIAEITAIKQTADELILTLNQISTDTNAATVMGQLATEANKLNATAASSWSAVLTSLQGIDGLQNLWKDDTGAVDTVTDLAAALSGNSVTTTKAEAWSIFLGALANNADAFSKLTGKTGEETKKWLEELAAGAKELSPDDAEAWETLINAFMGGIDLNTDEGKQFTNLLAQNYLAMGNKSEEAVRGLQALGLSTSDIEQRQETWLATCKELVRTIPGLSSLIDTTTGEIKGGLPALQDYADEWERTAKYQAEIEALNAAKDVYNAANNQEKLNADIVPKQGVAIAKTYTWLKPFFNVDEETAIDWTRKNISTLGDKIRQLVDEGETSWERIKDLYFPEKQTFESSQRWAAWGLSDLSGAYGETQEAIEGYAQAVFKAYLNEKELPLVQEEIARREKEIQDEYQVTAEKIAEDSKAAEEAAQSLTKMERAARGDADAMTELETATDNAKQALASMADYAENVHKSVESSVRSVIKGFQRVGKAGDELRDKSAEYEEEYKDAEEKYRGSKDIRNEWRDANGNLDLRRMQDNYESLNKAEQEAYNTLAAIYKKQQEINNQAEEYKPTNMIANLNSQLRFMQEYTENLNTLRSWGLSDELLSSLSDGSAESAEYLAGLVQGGKKAAQEVDQKYKEVQESQKKFTDTLTDSQLKADETYQKLYQDAQEAVAKLGEISGSAETNAKAIANSVAQGINEEMPNVKSAVDSIIAELDRLTSLNVTITIGASGTSRNAPHNYVSTPLDGEFETGLDMVPFNGFLASLHEGEGILTAEENRVWQRFKNGGGGGVDYDAMGGVMRDNIKPGGNVYLDGKIVGSVISEQQGKSFRQLQRSGWQG